MLSVGISSANLSGISLIPGIGAPVDIRWARCAKESGYGGSSEESEVVVVEGESVEDSEGEEAAIGGTDVRLSVACDGGGAVVACL